MIYPTIIPSQMLQPYQVATHFTFTVLKHSNTLCLIHRRLYHQEFRWSLLPYVNSVEVRRLIILHTEYIDIIWLILNMVADYRQSARTHEMSLLWSLEVCLL